LLFFKTILLNVLFYGQLSVLVFQTIKSMTAKALLTNDEKLVEIIQIIPEPKLESTYDVFFDLMSCIIEQQIHYRSTKKIFKKLLEKADLFTLTPVNFGDFEDKALSGIKLSLAKYETMGRVLDFWQQNTIDWEKLNDAEVTEKLAAIKGIGKWTIDMILLYTLQRPNIFPADDFHLKEIMTGLYGLDVGAKLKKQMLSIAESWQPHKSLAVRYLLAWKEYNKKK
jgi:DNA-3-methyladenine glycosylase II